MSRFYVLLEDRLATDGAIVEKPRYDMFSKGKAREVGIQIRTHIAVSKDKCAKKKRSSSVLFS